MKSNVLPWPPLSATMEMWNSSRLRWSFTKSKRHYCSSTSGVGIDDTDQFLRLAKFWLDTFHTPRDICRGRNALLPFTLTVINKPFRRLLCRNYRQRSALFINTCSPHWKVTLIEYIIGSIMVIARKDTVTPKSNIAELKFMNIPIFPALQVKY